MCLYDRNDRQRDRGIKHRIHKICKCPFEGKTERRSTLILVEMCPTEEMIASLDEEMNAFSEDNNICVDVNDQVVNGAYWLQRMLTGMVTLLSPNDDHANAVLEINTANTQDANNQTDQEKELVVWLYSCVQMSGLFAEELIAEVE